MGRHWGDSKLSSACGKKPNHCILRIRKSKTERTAAQYAKDSTEEIWDGYLNTQLQS